MKPLDSFRALADRFPAFHMLSGSPRKASIPFVQQLSTTDCGAACLAMVLRFHGLSGSLEALRSIAVSGRDASNAQALIDAGKVFGLRGRAVSLDIDQLDYLERGAILHWGFTHFVVFDRRARHGVYVVDPRRGRWCVPMDQFRKQFTGVAIVFEPLADFTPAPHGTSGTREGRRHYVRMIWRERRFLPHIVAASLLLQLLGLGFPLLNRLLIDRVIPQGDYSLLGLLAAAMGFLILFQFWTSLIRAQLLLYLRTRLDATMTLGFFDHLLSLPFDFFQRRSPGDLLMRMSSNATVRDILTGTALSAVLDGSLVIGYFALLTVFSWPLAMLTGFLALVQVVLVVVTRRRQRQLLAEGIDTQAKSQSYLIETLSAVEALKSLGAQDRAVSRWSTLFAADLNVSLKRGRLDSVVESLRSAIRMASSMALLLLGVSQVLAGAMTLGDMMAATALANSFLGPVVALASSAARLQLLGVYMERITDVIQTPSERDRTTTREPGALSGAITLDEVSFRYGPTSALVVRDVTLSVQPKEFVAIVGRSGAGKSTLARLMVGLYSPTTGSVRYDGLDLTQVDVSKLRQQLGVVTQQAQLFGGSIRANIALADPSLPLADIEAAARLACLHDDIMAMPMGYDTLLTDRGGSLSGGQQQRLALARALVSQPRILVLDEATSQVDAATERAIRDQLATLSCTRVVLAHRLSTIVEADRIIVMDAGRVVEEGGHDELVAEGGVYARLVGFQNQGHP